MKTALHITLSKYTLSPNYNTFTTMYNIRVQNTAEIKKKVLSSRYPKYFNELGECHRKSFRVVCQNVKNTHEIYL